jgi:hypothetical protein
MCTTFNVPEFNYISVIFYITPLSGLSVIGITFSVIRQFPEMVARSDVAYRVKVQATFIARFIGAIISTETVDKTITVTVTDLDDEAPTNIQISNTDLPADSPVGTLVGTLSATDVDTDVHLPFLQR